MRVAYVSANVYVKSSVAVLLSEPKAQGRTQGIRELQKNTLLIRAFIMEVLIQDKRDARNRVQNDFQTPEDKTEFQCSKVCLNKSIEICNLRSAAV